RAKRGPEPGRGAIVVREERGERGGQGRQRRRIEVEELRLWRVRAGELLSLVWRCAVEEARAGGPIRRKVVAPLDLARQERELEGAECQNEHGHDSQGRDLRRALSKQAKAVHQPDQPMEPATEPTVACRRDRSGFDARLPPGARWHPGPGDPARARA